MGKLFDKLTFGRDYLFAAAVYFGLGLIMFAITPSQSQLRAGVDECGGACEEPMVCVGNEETGYYCACAPEE